MNFLSIMSILIAVISSFLGAFGGYFLKKGSTKRFFNKYMNYGLLIYGLSAMLLTFSLKYSELSLIFPITGITYVWTQVIAKKYLKEDINKYKLIGITCIIMGVIIIQF